MKLRGERFERELVEKLWSIGFAAVRTPASGSMSYPCPDVIAGNGKDYLAIEVKMRKSLPIYVSRDEIDNLNEFSKIFGAKPILALKVRGLGWRFFTLDVLEKCGYKIDEDCLYIGLDLKDLKEKGST